MDARAGLLIRYGGDFVDGLVARASGSFVEMADGQRVLDFTAGQICATVGHNHPRVVAAIEAACREVLHLNSWMLSEPVLALAERLVGTLPEPLRRVMLLSTGGEGIEAALRMAKLSSGRFEVAALTRSWHGVTAGASAVTYAAGRAATARPRPARSRCRRPTRTAARSAIAMAPAIAAAWRRVSTCSIRPRSARRPRWWPSRCCRRAG